MIGFKVNVIKVC